MRRECTQLLDQPAPYAEWGSWSLAFPCAQLERQQPGSHVQMGQSADGSKIKFYKHSKIRANPEVAQSLWKGVEAQPQCWSMQGNAVKWTFTKFHIDQKAVW